LGVRIGPFVLVARVICWPMCLAASPRDSIQLTSLF